jgi:hypothetical protein
VNHATLRCRGRSGSGRYRYPKVVNFLAGVGDGPAHLLIAAADAVAIFASIIAKRGAHLSSAVTARAGVHRLTADQGGFDGV